MQFQKKRSKCYSKIKRLSFYPRESVRHIIVVALFASTSVIGLPVYSSLPGGTPAIPPCGLMNRTATTMLLRSGPEVGGPAWSAPATGRRGKPDAAPCVHRPQLEAGRGPDYSRKTDYAILRLQFSATNYC